MKNITNYSPDKYSNDPLYQLVEEGIYTYENSPQNTYTFYERHFRRDISHGMKYRYGVMFTSELQPKMYVTSLSFEQEPKFGEGTATTYISQYPLETVLERFGVWVQDFYLIENTDSKKKCYQEFASRDLKEIRKLRSSIIGKHVYERPTKKDKNLVELVIE